MSLGAVTLVGFDSRKLVGFGARAFPLEGPHIAATVGILGVVTDLYTAWNAARTDSTDVLRRE